MARSSWAEDYQALYVSRELDTKAKAEHLRQLLTVEHDGQQVKLYEAVDQAINNEIARIERKKARKKK